MLKIRHGRRSAARSAALPQPELPLLAVRDRRANDVHAVAAQELIQRLDPAPSLLKAGIDFLDLLKPDIVQIVGVLVLEAPVLAHALQEILRVGLGEVPLLLHKRLRLLEDAVALDLGLPEPARTFLLGLETARLDIGLGLVHLFKIPADLL